jgi:hypothetical protein
LGILPRWMRSGLAGYLHGMFTRTIPRSLMSPPPRNGRGGEHGKVLYRGPASICYAGTSPSWGFRFRAFPFAGLIARRFNMRVYSGNSLEATLHMYPLWTGAHPVPKMHNWLLTACRASFDRPVRFQIGGDRMGVRQVIDYEIADEQVDLVDWSATATA